MTQYVKRPQLVDAQLMAEAHPTTFHAPTTERLATIKPGFFVKVAPRPRNAIGKITERFWVEVITVRADMIVGRIDNELKFTRWHGLKYRDLIELEQRNIYDIMPPTQ